jgi:hypothetical protein
MRGIQTGRKEVGDSSGWDFGCRGKIVYVLAEHGVPLLAMLLAFAAVKRPLPVPCRGLSLRLARRLFLRWIRSH